MEPTNHPIEKAIHLPHLHFWVQNVNFQRGNTKDSVVTVVGANPAVAPTLSWKRVSESNDSIFD